MTGWPALLATCALVAAAGIVGRGPSRSARRRLRTSIGGRRPVSSGPVTGARAMPALAAALAGVAVAVVLGGWVGLVSGIGSALLTGWALGRLEPRSVRARRVAIESSLPFAADLIGAVLTAGAPVPAALTSVGAAIGGPLGELLRQVARGYDLGSPPEEAWQPLAATPAALPLIRAAIRAAESGAALAGACERAAAELRESGMASAEAAAKRAEVLIVLPLGLCFLPAFALVGVVPTVLGVLDGALG
jgi:pilus assembly protein TadC